MTASQPPTPPPGGQPGPGDPSAYGQPTGPGMPGSAPPPGFPAPTGGPQPLPGNQPPHAAASQLGHSGGGAGFSMDLKKLRMADYVIGAGTVLYLIFGVLTWVSLGSIFGLNIPGADISGFSFDGNVGFAFVLFLLATAWTVLPAFYALEVGFPRSYVTVGLAVLGLLLTLFAWIHSLRFEFKIVPLLALLTAIAIAVFAVLTLLPELRNGPGLPGGLAKAGQWANRPGSASGHSSAPSAPAAPPAGAPQQPYAPPQQYAPPPAPPAPGGSSTPDSGAAPGPGQV